MLHPTRLGFAGGIVWGLCMFICTIISIYTGYASLFLNIMSTIYPGYVISWWGSLIGFLYGFLDAFVGLFILALIYNLLKPKSQK